MSIPIWKVRRELRATYDQLHALLIRICFPVIRLKHRFFPAGEPAPVKGQRTLGKRVVIYLVFPGNDELSDRLDAMDYFIDQGSSIICVVNGRLDPQWVVEFGRRSAYVLIRDNNGYDFGGYKRGVLFLGDLNHSFDHLHIINDSVLIPVVSNEAIFLNIESAVVSGFGGAVALPMGKSVTDAGQHAQAKRLALSYWLYFSESVARADCFKAYWFNYVATSSKVLTVRYGERGLSRYMAAHGYQANALYTVDSVSDMLQDLTSDALLLTLQYASFTDDIFIAKRAQLLAEYQSSTEWSAAARDFIKDVAAKRNFLHSFCYLAHELCQIPFIKKTRIRLPYLMRQQYIAAVAEGHMMQPPPRIWSRILAISS